MNCFMTRFGYLLAALFVAAPGVAADDYLDAKVPVQRVVSDCRFTEGPSVDALGNVYFSDGPNDRVMKLGVDGMLDVFYSPCGVANGTKFDDQGRLVMCQSTSAKGKRRVARRERDGSETVLAETFEGKRFNAPNDLTLDAQGRIYFTDIAVAEPGKTPEMPSGVYRIDSPGQVVRVIDNLQRPNGIVLTRDGKTLYVSDRGTQKLHRYEVQSDASLKSAGIVYDFSPDRGIDGMCLDLEGNIVAAAGQGATSGLFVVSPLGKLLLHRPIGEFSTNVCFAGDGRDLYLTASKSVYKLRCLKPGWVLQPRK